MFRKYFRKFFSQNKKKKRKRKEKKNRNKWVCAMFGLIKKFLSDY